MMCIDTYVYTHKESMKLSADFISHERLEGLVKPILEYCSTVWDPQHIKKI